MAAPVELDNLDELIAKLSDCLDRLDALGHNQAAAAVETAIINLGGAPKAPPESEVAFRA